LERGTARFLAELSRQTGIFFKRKPVDSPSPTLWLHAVHVREKVQGLSDDESYQLVISASGASLTAPSSLGILHGFQTFLQLVETTANHQEGPKEDFTQPAGVTYVDSSGVGQLVGALTTARNQAADIKLLKPSVHVLDLLKTTKLHGVFDIQEDETAAIQSFSRGAGATS
jgi:anti-anti-sigma factor